MNIPTNHRDDQLLWISEVIHSHDIAIINVGSGRCSTPGCRCGPSPVPWSYSIGFAERSHPEVVAFGLPPDHAGNLLNWVRRREAERRALRPGSVVLVDGRWIRFDAVPTEWIVSELWPMGAWFAHYGVGRAELDPPEVMQLVWADRSGRFPEDAECEPICRDTQPVGAALLGDWTGESGVAARPRQLRRRAARAAGAPRRHRPS